MSVSQLNAETFDSTVSEDKATLIDFFAEWCGPCKMQTPVLHKVADEYSSKMNFGAVKTKPKRLQQNTEFNRFLH